MKIQYKKYPPGNSFRGYPFEVAVACGYIPEYPQPFLKRWWNRLRLRLLPSHPPTQEIHRSPTCLDIGCEGGDIIMSVNLPNTGKQARDKELTMIDLFRAEAIREGKSTEALDKLADLVSRSEDSWSLCSAPDFPAHFEVPEKDTDENNAVPEVPERVDAGSNPFETDSQRPEQG